jgi:hypothetical protein
MLGQSKVGVLVAFVKRGPRHAAGQAAKNGMFIQHTVSWHKMNFRKQSFKTRHDCIQEISEVALTIAVLQGVDPVVQLQHWVGCVCAKPAISRTAIASPDL